MIRWRKSATVAWFELSSTVRRLGYLVLTFGMPVFAAIYGSIAVVPGYLMAQEALRERSYGVVDERALLGFAPGQKVAMKTAEFVSFADEADAGAALEAEEIDAYYVLPSDYLATGAVHAYARERDPLGPWGASDALSDLVRRRLLERKVDATLSERIVLPLAQRKTFRVMADGTRVRQARQAIVGRLILPIGFALLLFSSILMSGSYLIQATATEKENKVVEVLLSSATAEEIMTGKLLGLGAAGLLQVTVWISMVLGVRGGFSELLAPLEIQLSWQAVALTPFLFVLAYLFFGSLMLGTGSLGGNVRESQQFGMLWALFGTAPLLFLPLMISDPHGPVAILMTFIPFSAPATLLFRTSLDPGGIALAEIIASMAMIAIATWLSVRVAARLFRVGLMLTGARPKLRDLLRQARPSA